MPGPFGSRAGPAAWVDCSPRKSPSRARRFVSVGVVVVCQESVRESGYLSLPGVAAAFGPRLSGAAR